ncbi:hypothetical protein [Sporisorium scitamineum]|uniref:Mig1 protein n=1 Tax=Sporisorium scitamineum TaxID=49012 RepID=A0A0F7S4Q0_9BASI|nr:hypothetical protein [Sporisorium scitamineum]
MSTKRCGLALAFTALLASIQIIPVAADGEITCSSQPPLLPRNSEYLAACHEADFVKETAVGLWPCFRHVTGNLSGANIFPSSEDKDSKSRLVAKNADLTDFTPQDMMAPFTIRLYVLAGDSPSIIVADTASANKAGVSCHKLIYLRLEKE